MDNENMESFGGRELVAERSAPGMRLGTRYVDEDLRDRLAFGDLTMDVSRREARAYARQILAELGPEEEDDAEMLWIGGDDSPPRTHTSLVVQIMVTGSDVERIERDLDLTRRALPDLSGFRVVKTRLRTDEHARGWLQIYTGLDREE